jgi:hypothetical protein
MVRLRESLKGYKAYLVGAGLVIAAGLKAQGYISEEVYQVLLGLLGGAGIAALRAGIKK